MQRAISPAMARSSASGDSSAPGVSMTVTSGSPSSSARRMPRRASRSAPGPMAWPRRLAGAVLADHDARLAVEAGQRHQHAWSRARPRRCRAAGGCRWRRGRAGRARPPGPYAGCARRCPRRRGRRPCAAPAAASRPGPGPSTSTARAASTIAGRSSAADDAVDDAGGGEVLRDLDAGPERPAVERLVDLGPEEADQRARLGHGDVAQRAPRGVDAAGGGVAQVHEVGQPGGAVVHQRPGDLDHPHEGGGALLHAGAARRGAGQQREPLGGRTAYGGGDAVRGGPADRAGEEAELVDHDGHRAPAHLTAAGDHRLVGAGLQRRRPRAPRGSVGSTPERSMG